MRLCTRRKCSTRLPPAAGSRPTPPHRPSRLPGRDRLVHAGHPAAVHRPRRHRVSAAILSDREPALRFCRRCDRSNLGCATAPRTALSGRSDRCPRTKGSRYAGGCRAESCTAPGLRSAIDNANLPGHGLAEMPKSPRFSPNSARVIDVLTYPAVQLLDVTGPIQVFASANDLVTGSGGTPPYVLRVVAQGGEGVTASAGVAIAAGPLTQLGEALDTLLVAGGAGAEAAAENPVLVDWVRQRATRARRVASVCTGAFLLASAGLLDGRRAATHWEYCARLAQRFPAVHVEPDPIFVCDGRVWTSAGVTAGIDLALALVEEDLGRSVALAVARHLVVFLKRPGGQAQFSAALALQAADDK